MGHTAERIRFDFLPGLPIVVEAQATLMSSDAGMIPIRQFDGQTRPEPRRVGFSERFVARLRDPRDPALEIVPKAHVAVLSGWRFGRVRMELTVHEFFYALARLGGHQNRRHDHPPGWIVLWRGWIKLQCMVDGATAVGFTRCG